MKRFFLMVCCLTLFAFSLHARPQHDVSGPLRFGVVTAVDSLPVILAYERGFFAEEGVAIELIRFPNPLERNTALQTRQLDGAVHDLLDAAIFTAAVRDDFRWVTFTPPALPTDQQANRALDWLRIRNPLSRELVPADLTDPRAIAEWSN